jgi:pyroglutamyl-peptidase
MRFRNTACFLCVLLFIVPLVFTSVSAGTVVLVTGFEPFGVHAINPSQVIAEILNGTIISDAEIIGIVLPVDFNRSVEEARAAIDQYHPDVVLSLGLAARSRVVKVEKIAVNLKRFPRDDGTWSFPQRIQSNGPFFRVTALDAGGIAWEMRHAGIPARQSFFAGTYICNSLFYALLGDVRENNLTASVGFIHVPLLDSQDPAGMSLETLVDAVKIAIQSCLG